MLSPTTLLPLVLTTLSLLPPSTHALALTPAPEKRQDATHHWVSTWTSMPQLVEPGNMPPAPYYASNAVLKAATLRQTLRLTLPSTTHRLTLSNVFGTTDLPITAATLALALNNQAGTPNLQPASPVVPVTVGGKRAFTVPKGQLVVTDEVAFEAKAGQVVTVSLYSREGQPGSSITGHPGSRTTSWFAGGDKTEAATMEGAKSVHWYFLSAIHALVPTPSSALVIIGDSITDGRGSTDDKNNRWPDLLHARMQAAAPPANGSGSAPGPASVAVNNQAAGGNCVLSQCLGPSALSRYRRDALDQPGVKYVMVFEGVNDIGNSGNVANQLIGAYKTIVADARKAGLVTIGGTITPFGGSSYAGGDKENARKTVNAWIKAKGNFDHFVDFAAAIENKGNPANMDSKYNGGDSLHPNVAGYQAMADAFPLDIFTA